MKPTMKKTELKDSADIWNAVIFEISNHDFPTNNPLINESFLAFQYYSELESGGHEILFNWVQEYIEEVGITLYLNDLSVALEKIGADDYGQIIKKYGEELWRLFRALENGEIDEQAFYELVEKADRDYYALGGKLEQQLEAHFLNIYTELFEII
ncbi:hypothetical protein [Planococcus shenhongbingii]|uniref:DUF4375 domain-containing protein n=1 Tax=Planococcus shenhongbingii TaxID=3058398 RepID=A0ABT8NDQ2_9BACL|nr:hypothetical protein [Planococcus sp. N017]MDN7246003.1 hypothetical protein [Planococcus sp. N017]